jgi:ribokinase
LIQIAHALRNKGVENIIITLGEHGSAVAREDDIEYIPCVQMPHVSDPTAAGDSFVGALSVALTLGLPQQEALAFASHTAAITVSRMGAMPSLPTLDEVILLLNDRDYHGFDYTVLDALR